jgi:hypothetical protein
MLKSSGNFFQTVLAVSIIDPLLRVRFSTFL